MSNEDLKTLASRMLDMLERVEWVKREGGNWHHCPFCRHVSERDLGPGHADDCEWLMVTREGNELRMVNRLR